MALAQVKVMPSDDGPSSLVNAGKHAIFSVRLGEVQWQRLDPGQSVEVMESGGQVVGGRFDLGAWEAALKDCSDEVLPHHLVTAGVYPDGIAPGKAGDPESSENIRALIEYKGTPFECAGGYVGRCGSILAFASRFLPDEQLSRILAAVDPQTINSQSPIRELPPMVALLRTAFERKGPQILATMKLTHNWLTDRGFHHPLLLATLGREFSFESHDRPRAVNFTQALHEMELAYAKGSEMDAAFWALEAVQFWNPSQGFERLEFICSGFDAGAALTMKSSQYAASFAYLHLMAKHCPDTESRRDRMGAWFSAQGVDAFVELRLETARVLFERAAFFSNTEKYRVQWADTLAELAILRFREGDRSAGRVYLEQAAELAPFRPRVLAAQDADPGGNQRAKIGLLVLIGFVAFFAIRRIRHVWFGELTRVRRTRRLR